MSFTSPSARTDLWLVAGAKTVTLLGDELALVALSLRLQSHGAWWVAGLFIANLVPIAALSGLVGRLVDRVSNRALLLGAGLTQAALCTALALTDSLFWTLPLVALLGAGTAVTGAIWQALVPAIAGEAALTRALSLVQAGSTVAWITAPALGGVLTGRYGARVPLLLDAVSFLAITVAAVLIGTRRLTVPAGELPTGALAIVRRDALLLPLFVVIALFTLLVPMVNVVEVFLIRQTLGASTTWYGLIGADFGIGLLIGSLAAGRLTGTGRTARAFVVAVAVLGAGLAAMGVVPSVGWLVPFGLVAGAANGVFSVCLGALVMGRAEPEQRGRIGALLSGIASGMQLLAFVAGGAVTATVGPRATFVLAGALGLATLLILARRLLRGARGAESTVVAVDLAA